MNLRDSFGVHRLTLRFPNALEQEFQHDQNRHRDAQVQTALLALTCLVAIGLVIFTIADPGGEGLWRQPSWDLFLNWSLIPVAFGLLAVSHMTSSITANRWIVVVVTTWFFIVGTKNVATDDAAFVYLAFMLVLLTTFFICAVSNLDFAYCVPLVVAQVIAVFFFAHEVPRTTSLLHGMIYLSAGAVLALIGGYCIERHRRQQFILQRRLQAQEARTEELLLNVLPRPIADRLKAGPGTIADRFDECTVLFADIVGFTQMSAKLGPDAMVSLLNRVFTSFDELAEAHGLEKIKTIGDAYMLVGNIPNPCSGHESSVAEMALDMQEAVGRLNEELELPLSIRVGMACGPVVAGVIGQKKFAYDLWGDTVNTASRMESHGLPGAVQVTEEVYHRLQNTYEFDRRGDIEVKGKGVMTTYILTGRTASAESREALMVQPS